MSHEIHLFLEKLESGSLGVDLVKIGLNYAQQQLSGKCSENT